MAGNGKLGAGRRRCLTSGQPDQGGIEMLCVLSSLNGYAIEAIDGRIGTVSDFLFDDQTWKMRWLVVDAGSWWTGSKVLIHPSAIKGTDYQRQELSVALTAEQVKGSPDILQDQPVSRQIEHNLHSYYGWDPLWSSDSYFGGNAMASPVLAPPFSADFTDGEAAREAAEIGDDADKGDPHLRSAAAVDRSHIHATDGEIGHLENLLVDDATWELHYLIIDTKSWWPGQHVLLSPHAVSDISYLEQEIRLNVTCDQVRASPPWEPSAAIDEAYERRLHTHYGWPGHGR
jgi:hypothetical protein